MVNPVQYGVFRFVVTFKNFFNVTFFYISSRLGDASSKIMPKSTFKIHRISYNMGFTAYNKLGNQLDFTKS